MDNEESLGASRGDSRGTKINREKKPTLEEVVILRKRTQSKSKLNEKALINILRKTHEAISSIQEE